MVNEHDIGQVQLHDTENLDNHTIETHDVCTNERVKTSFCGRQIKKPKKLELYDCT